LDRALDEALGRAGDEAARGSGISLDGPAEIDPFEHLLDQRVKRWELDRGEFGPDLLRLRALVRPDPGIAPAKCRVILVAVMRTEHERAAGRAGTKPLEQIIRDLARQGGLPRKVQALAEAVRELGNAGSHPIPDGEDLCHREAQVAALALLLILEWHRRASGAPDPGDDYCI
jgi:hypothetical protein